MEPTRPTLSGDGGEIARGFYYPSPGVLSEIRKGGEEDLAERLEQEARGEHSAAHRGAYRAYRSEVERALAEGRRHGLAGAGLLDYFYLVHRLASRSGLGARPAATRPASPRPSSAPPSTSPPSSASRESSTTT